MSKLANNVVELTGRVILILLTLAVFGTFLIEIGMTIGLLTGEKREKIQELSE